MEEEEGGRGKRDGRVENERWSDDVEHRLLIGVTRKQYPQVTGQSTVPSLFSINSRPVDPRDFFLSSSSARFAMDSDRKQAQKISLPYACLLGTVLCIFTKARAATTTRHHHAPLFKACKQ